MMIVIWIVFYLKSNKIEYFILVFTSMPPLGLTKKILFINNKWWVGQTTLCFNIGSLLAKQWYRVLLVDADPQCNLTLQALWQDTYTELWLFEHNSIYHLVLPLIRWIGDIDMTITPMAVPDIERLDIIPWNLYFSDFDDLLSTSFVETAQAQERWFIRTSALNRYLDIVSKKNNYDLILIDTSPSLTGSLNKMLTLMSDYFVCIARPDLFSLQWIRHLWERMHKRKDERNTTKRIASTENRIVYNTVLSAACYFIWYIINEYNVYNKKAIARHTDWMTSVAQEIQVHLSALHSINGLGKINRSQPLWSTQDYGQLSAIWQEYHIPIWSIEQQLPQWSEQLLKKSQLEFQHTIDILVQRLQQR